MEEKPISESEALAEYLGITKEEYEKLVEKWEIQAEQDARDALNRRRKDEKIIFVLHLLSLVFLIIAVLFGLAPKILL